MARVLGGALWLVALCGCNSPPAAVVDADAGVPADADAGPAPGCGPTLKPAGKACLPMLDPCPGNQVPVPGGTCQRVGVEPCKTAEGGPGLEGPPDWTCKRVGPPTTCLSGWALTKDAWCEPVLPGHACPDGTIEVIGKSTCQPMADCGSGTYGNIQLTADTVFVDQAYSGTDSDGSQAKPFATVAGALLAAPADRDVHIAVAAGTYNNEQLQASFRSVTLEGRCPQMVTLEGSVFAESCDVTLRGLTLRAAGTGVQAYGGLMQLDRVAVVDCGGYGVYAHGGAKVVITDAVVARNHSHGIHVGKDTSVEVERSVVRATSPTPTSPSSGYGVAVYTGGKLTLCDAVVSGNHRYGVYLSGSTARIERSAIEGTEPLQPEGTYGFGISAVAAEVEVVDSLLASNSVANVHAAGASKVTVERTVVRDTRAAGTGSAYGFLVYDSSLVVRDTAVARARYLGVYVDAEAVPVVIERTLVLDTAPRLDGAGGHGIGLVFRQPTTQPAQLTLADTIVSNSRTTGVGIHAAEAKLKRVLVQDTLPPKAGGAYGVGVSGLARVGPTGTFPARLSIVDSTITGSAFAGVAIYGSEATVQTTVVRDTHEPSPRRWGGPGVMVSSLAKAGSTLKLQDSLVADSSDFGVFVEGSQATLERVAIQDTQPRLGDKAGGFGVYAWPGDDGVSTALTVHDCQVTTSGTAGIYVLDAPLDLQRSQVTSTSGDSQGFGDGVVAQGAQAKLLVLDSLVSDSLRCGLLTKGADGLVDRSMLTKGQFSVVVDQGAQLNIGLRAELTGNAEDRVTFGENIGTPPPPVVPPPPKMPETEPPDPAP